MPTTLSAHEKTVKQIFSDEYAFNVPSYQRPYAWTTEQAGELLDDLLAALPSGSGPVEDLPPYFLGSIVLIKAEGSADADVVDGQQRLTTLTILFAALRASLPDALASDLTLFIHQPGNAISDTPERFRLRLRQRDAAFFNRVQRANEFEALIETTDPLSDSQSNIRANARLFVDRLADIGENHRLRLAKYILTRSFLVAVSTPDLDSAYRIFSVMNSRGLDLSAADILKAQLIGGLAAGERATYTERWETAEEELGRDAFTELFGHIRMIFRQAKPKATLLKEFQEHVCAGVAGRDVIDQRILPYAKAYSALVDAAYESASGAEIVNEHLRWLNRLEFSDWMPPALEFTVLHRHDPARMASFFRDLERLAYHMLVCRTGVNDRIERFARLTDEVRTGVGRDGGAIMLTASEMARAREELDGPVYDRLNPRARSTLLLRLDALVSGGGAHYDYPVVTVEHVLPQNPPAGSAWLHWFPDDADRADWTHRIGNLALLTRKKNSAASNYDFARKKAAYFTKDGVSPFALTTDAVQHGEWTRDVVAQRQARLLATLVKHWRL